MQVRLGIVGLLSSLMYFQYRSLSIVETLGSVKGADPDNRLTNKAKRHMQTHRATPEEQRLAEALKVVSIIYFLISRSKLTSVSS